MRNRKVKLGASITLLAAVVSCLLVFSSFAAASQAELNSVWNGIQQNKARWVAGDNEISRLPETEKQRRLGLKLHAVKVPKSQLLTASPPTGATLPVILDYRSYNGMNDVTPVKNQGSCGDCWAFATTAALESQVLMKTSISTNEAEQLLVSCSGAGNCSGGYIDKASSFIESTGLPPETCFPYTGTNSACSAASCPNWQSDTYKITGWQWVTTTSPTVAAIKNALLAYGPLVTTMNVYADFFYYTSGVYSYTSGAYEGGHAIEIIGWNDDDQAFIVKNSWGTGWGEAGFFEIAYSQLTNGVAFGGYTIAYSGANNNTTTCSYTVSPASASFSYAGGSGTITVSSQSGCSWSAVSNASWLKVTTGASGSAEGSVGYSVSANTTTSHRTGSLTVAGRTFTITQTARSRR